MAIDTITRYWDITQLDKHCTFVKYLQNIIFIREIRDDNDGSEKPMPPSNSFKTLLISDSC